MNELHFGGSLPSLITIVILLLFSLVIYIRWPK